MTVSGPPPPPAQDHGVLQQIDLEKLGRQRPAVFASALSEYLFCFSLLMTSMMAEYFVSGFNIVVPAIDTIEIPPEDRTWPISVFNLVTGSFLLPFGRLADIYGGHVVYVSGLAWLLVWSIIGGFSTNVKMLIASRAIAGLGPAAFMPASIMLLGKTYRPGPRKNLVFGLYGACAPLGFYLGIIIGGVTSQLLSWSWYFYLGAIILGLVVVISIFFVPSDWNEERPADIKMDYLGTATTVTALTLLVFAVTYGAHAPDGWRTPYIIVTVVLGAAFLGAAVYVEGWVATQPLLPFDMFKPKYMVRMVIALFFCYGAFGIFLLYSSYYIQDVIKMSPLLSAVWYTPMAAGGIILATMGGFTMHLLPGRLLLIISGLGGVAQMLFFALVPAEINKVTFWGFVFPAMIGSTLNIDITYNVTNVFITTNVPRHRQGAAGAVIFSLLFLGTSFFLGLADIVVAETEWKGTRGSYKAAFWFGTAASAVTLILYSTIRIGSAKSQLLIEEQEAQENQRNAQQQATEVSDDPA